MGDGASDHSLGFAPTIGLDGPWLEALSAEIAKRADPRLTQTLARVAPIIRSQPEHPDALYTLGMLANQVGLRELAAGLIAKASELAPDRIDFIGDLGNVYGDMGRFGEAIACYRRVLALQPDLALAHNNLGNTLQEQGDLETALAAYRRALELQPDYVEAWGNLGNTLEKSGDLEGAEAAFQKALAIRPDYLQAKVNLGVAYHLRGKMADAIQCLEQALAGNPRHLAGAMRLLRIYLEQGDYGRAGDLYRHIKSLAPGNQTASAAEAICHLAGGDAARFDYLYRPDGLPAKRTLGLPPGYDDLAQFNAELAEEIQAHPSFKRIHDSHETSQRGFVYGLLDSPPPAIAAFIAQLDRNLEAFKAELRQDPAHPFFGRMPERTSVNLWATVLQSGGWHPPHFHEHNWLSGVYYVAMPALDERQEIEQQGWLEFDGFTHLPGLEGESGRVLRVRPEPGCLVLFPSYLMHATRPFESDELRISMAFDIKPL